MRRTEAEYVAAANCCGQVLWIQNQMLDYGFNFMNIKIYIDNESTICIVKNLVFHSKTKHIEIRHHFIRDSYEKKLIQGRLIVLICSRLCTNDALNGIKQQLMMKFKLVLLVYLTTDRYCQTVDNGEQEITATVDGKEFTITEASVRRHLQLADVEGISVFPTTKIFD
ncbi:hypothetical protein Tco_0769776 [Tanacetum coccineum]|uniref:Uncharacterized protein n=1 Tax=Tanacetum coccineum TaxID=301880 RepID=A0ABQ4ZBC7_9ASTR